MIKVYEGIKGSNTILLEGSNGRVIGLSNDHDLGIPNNWSRWDTFFYNLKRENIIEIDLKVFKNLKAYKSSTSSLILFNNTTGSTTNNIFEITPQGEIIEFDNISIIQKECVEIDTLLINN